MKIIKILTISFIFNLINADNNFLIKRDNPRHLPKAYIEKALTYFKARNGKTIVEIGAMRFAMNHNLDKEWGCPYCMDGHSTLFWARTNAQVFSVDIGEATVNIVKEACKNYKNVNAVKQDGIEFLKNFGQPIDLLFLDAWDAVPGTDYAEKHLEAYEAAKKSLHNNSLILIDDTDVYEGGKGRLVIPAAMKDGYKVVFNGRQTLLSK